MSKGQMLRALVKQRLSAAERLYSQHYECPADVQQPSVGNDEVPPEHQDQDDPPELPHIKEEQEEFWTNQEGEQLQELKSVKEEENCQMETDTDGDDCGGEEAARNSDPKRRLHPETEDSSEPEVSDGADETREPRPDLNSVVDNVTNRDSFVCSMCGKTFVHKTNLKRHQKCHSGEKPFSCSFCSKTFSRREHVVAHMRCHSGEKPFSCSVCSSSFSHCWSLDKHMRVHTGEKPFGCSLCNKTFRQRSDLVAHCRIHTGEKPFTCSLCKSSFTQRHTLVQHMRTHSGLKPFICSVCGKRFSRKGHMTRHMSAHSGEKPFSCSVCERSFTWQSQFKRHECAGESSCSK